MYGTPAVHSYALLGVVPNLQVDYTTGLKPLASILNIRKAVTAQTHIRNTKQESSKSDFIIFISLSHIPI